MHYGPELIQKIRQKAFENEFRQSPENPICPQVCGWDEISLDESEIIIVLTLDVHNVNNTERKLLHLSVGLSSGEGHASEETTMKVVKDILGADGVVEIPQDCFPPQARTSRQFFFEASN